MTLDLIMGVCVWLLGLCVGSFLNVVVYRLPLGLSLNNPARSFCPACRQPIAWYDNIPVLSWLLLCARCRRCTAPISVQYPLVEALTGLIFVLVYYLLFVAHARAAVNQPAHPADWPLLAAWLVLVAALIACAAMDVVSYMVDVRVTGVAVLAGIVLHAAWPCVDFFAAQAHTPLALGAAAVFLVSILMLWLTVWREDDDEPEPEPPAEAPTAPAPHSSAAVLVGRLAVAIFVGLTLWLLAETVLRDHQTRNAAHLRLPRNVEAWNATAAAHARGLASDVVVPAVLLTAFATAVLLGGQRRAADEEVSAAIEEEKPQARRVVLAELAWLAPSIIAGLAAYALVTYWPPAQATWHAAVTWSPGAGFYPLAGAAFAMLGAVVAAAVGWTLRIVFTLVFGREALGTGDIYILAAAGATAGWDIALFGLLLAVGVAIAGFVLSLLLKRSGIIAFGPWLAIGFLAALWLNRPAAEIAAYYHVELLSAWSQRPDICLVAGGVMLVGSVAAVIFARLVRRLIPPPGPAAPEPQVPASDSPDPQPVATDPSEPQASASARQYPERQ